MSEQRLRTAMEFEERDLGTLTWDASHNSDTVSVGDEGLAWVPIRTEAHLHSGVFAWDFVVEEMANAQIGVGFMLQWDRGLDWGFFGYLGAGPTAWSYDPYTGTSSLEPSPSLVGYRSFPVDAAASCLSVSNCQEPNRGGASSSSTTLRRLRLNCRRVLSWFRLLAFCARARE